MKALLILVVIVVIGGVAVYHFGGYGSFDPTQQGLDAKKAITPGMTVDQVVQVAGAPNDYAQLNRIVKKAGPDTMEFVEPSGPIKFRQENLEERIANNDLPEGFLLIYVFSAQAAFEVYFDSAGQVTEIRDRITMADLLQTRK